MHGYLPRVAEPDLDRALARSPAAVILGPRQCGKSTLAKLMAAMPRWRPSFVRAGNGAEVDLVLERGQRLLVFEINLSKAPQPSRRLPGGGSMTSGGRSFLKIRH
jgi:hypothetical protein